MERCAKFGVFDRSVNIISLMNLTMYDIGIG